MLLQQPDILILDEATSALDETGQEDMLRVLSEALAPATMISVGHRTGLAAFHQRKITLIGRENRRCADLAGLAAVKAQCGCHAAGRAGRLGAPGLNVRADAVLRAGIDREISTSDDGNQLQRHRQARIEEGQHAGARLALALCLETGPIQQREGNADRKRQGELGRQPQNAR